MKFWNDGFFLKVVVILMWLFSTYLDLSMNAQGKGIKNGQVARSCHFQVWNYFQQIVEKNEVEKARCIACGSQFQLETSKSRISRLLFHHKMPWTLCYVISLLCY